MSNISNIGDVYHWSIAKIAEAFAMDRKVVKKSYWKPIFLLPVLFGGILYITRYTTYKNTINSTVKTAHRC